MAKSKIVPLTIICDSREQLPYSFKEYPCKVIRKALKTGDYSVEGYENEVVIERKSHPDAYASFGRERARFKREFQRLAKYKYAALVIEASLSSLIKPPAYSQMRPQSVINSILSWGIRYKVQVYFADSRTLAECLVYRILEKFIQNRVKETKDLLLLNEKAICITDRKIA